MPAHVVVIDEIIANQHVHEPKRERGVGSRQQGDVSVALFGGERAVGIDGDEPRPEALRLLRARPKMYARGNRVAAPENDELGLIGQLHVDSDSGAQGDRMAGGAGRCADRAIQKTCAEPMEEALGHRLALHQPHGSGVAIGQDLLRIVRGDGAEASRDRRDGFVPTDSLEAPFPLLANPAQRMQQPIRVIGSFRIARHLGTERAGGGAVLGRSGHFEGHAVLDMHLESAGVGTIVRASALDDRYRRRRHGAWRSGSHPAYPPSRMRSINFSHCPSCASATNSFGRCASAMSPGPQITLGTPIFWNNPASVPYDTLPTWRLLESRIAHCTIASVSRAARPTVWLAHTRSMPDSGSIARISCVKSSA